MSSDNPLIVDLESLFRYSGLLDQLRDTARLLVKRGSADAATLAAMTSQYEQLREELRGVLRDDIAAEIDRWAPDVPDASAEAVFFATASLARWMDLVHQTPQFLLSQQVAEANSLEVGAKVAEALQRQRPVPSSDAIVAMSMGTGQYL